MNLKDGLYEQVINEIISNKINNLSDKKYIDKTKIDEAESSSVLAQYMYKVMQKSLNYVQENKGDDITKLKKQIDICNKIIEVIEKETKEESVAEFTICDDAEMLLSIVDKMNKVDHLKDVVRPITPLSQSSLFTGTKNEPSLGSEIKKEIASCDRIDMLVSFIKWSGIRTIINELKEFTKDKKLRIITTSYMGATDYKAIEFLSKLPNTEVKISYDTKRTRLHAKAYYFHRETGFTTAYIGSSNLSDAAISSGLEWNMKLSEQTSKEILNKFQATFESYWNDKEFYTFDSDKEENVHMLKRALSGEKRMDSNNNYFSFDIQPYSYQKEILDKLKAEREIHHKYKNLVVAATGTGKTVISAFDYKNYCAENPNSKNRLLFIAHRKEILEQSRDCFRGILKDNNFGELWVGEHVPEKIDQLFMSIQTFNSKEFIEKTSKDYYDFIIVDEFHHAAAPSYQDLLNYYEPKILLGLTATPERMDDKDVLKYFDYRIAAEIRLGEAINRKLLCPFQYFGVTDSVDLSDLKWSRGGYLKTDLDNVYTKNDQRASLVADKINEYVTNLNDVKGLGFCVSVEHAEYMSSFFNKRGIKSIALNADSDKDIRNEAKSLISKGEVKFIFVVDLYNEGVDIPDINTVLFLRPTESLTVFLQQLGRGLRLSEGKECSTVLDFIGQANQNYNFDSKLRALIGKTHNETSKEILNDFPNLPKGCHIQLERVARDYVLENISKAVVNKNNIKAKIKMYKQATDKELNLINFLSYYNLELKDIYKKWSFNRLLVEARVKENFHNEDEKVLTKALGRLLHINSMSWLNFLVDKLENIQELDENNLSEEERKMLLMFHYTIWNEPLNKIGVASLKESMLKLYGNRELYDEVLHILKINRDNIDFIEEKMNLNFPCPLELHCRYSRDEILSAVGYYEENRKPAQREGVKYLEDKKLDIFFITLNKSEKDYSPSTMYEDYAISEELFHWQSQSTTSENSKTGQRYINHRKMGSKVVLFVREFNEEDGLTSSYYCLGTANYVNHVGERPMSIVWRLEMGIPSNIIGGVNRAII